MYQLIVYIPEEALETVKNALFAAGGGNIGNYSHCAWQVRGQGQFRPLAGSRPHTGTRDHTSHIEEWRLELIVPAACKHAVIQALKNSHPYETPAYHLIRIESE